MPPRAKPSKLRQDANASIWALVSLILAAGAARSSAQYVDWSGSEQTDQWTSVAPRLRYIKTDVESEWDTYSSTGSSQLQANRIFLTTGFGLSWNNYIYHPYLLSYSLLMEPAYYLQENTESGATSQANLWLLTGSFTANILEAKPYATAATYTRSHEEVKYDFFSSATVDTEGWGVRSGWSTGPVPVSVSLSQSHEDSSGLNQDSITDETELNLEAKNERRNNDQTDLNYQYNIFQRSTTAGLYNYNSEEDYQHISLADTENFHKSTLHSSILFTDIQSPNSTSSDQLNAMVNWNVEHSPTLHSYYDYSFSENSSGPSDSYENTVTAGVTHQLYDSLTSGGEVHASQLDSTSFGSTLDSYQFGVSESENYTKRLGNWGHLTLANNATYDWNDQETSGTEQVIANESYVVPATGLVQLKQPRDIAVSTVTDSTGTIPLQLGLDYNLIRTTNPWQIQINSLGPAHIAPGQSILVTYTIMTNPSGSYTELGNESQASLSFWHDHASVFARYSFTDNQASSAQFVLENEQEFGAGADLNWHGCAVHGEYVDHRSSIYNSTAYTFSESCGLMSLPRSSLGLNMNQQWSTSVYNIGATNSTQQMTFYDFMLHLDSHPTAHLTWTAEVGYRRQRGFGADQNLFAARTYLNWTVGKLEVHCGYEHQNQEFDQQKLDRDYVFLRIRRNF